MTTYSLVFQTGEYLVTANSEKAAIATLGYGLPSEITEVEDREKKIKEIGRQIKQLTDELLKYTG